MKLARYEKRTGPIEANHAQAWPLSLLVHCVGGGFQVNYFGESFDFSTDLEMPAAANPAKY
jgi:hypothetical protein